MAVWSKSIQHTHAACGSRQSRLATLWAHTPCGIVHQGVAFPLLWWMLDKKGNSNTDERIDLLQEFVELFCEHQIDYLSADREFLGHKWLEYLFSQPMMSFRIRVRETELLGDGQHWLPAKIIFSHLQIGQQFLLKRKRILWGRGLESADVLSERRNAPAFGLHRSFTSTR